MKIGVIIAFVAGVALTLWLVLHIGVGSVFDSAARVGWGGFALICLSGLVMEAVSGLAFFFLVPGGASWPVFVAARRVRDSGRLPGAIQQRHEVERSAVLRFHFERRGPDERVVDRA